MHLAVDARVVAQDARGIGRYERAILRRMLSETNVRVTLLLPELFARLRRRALAQALDSTRFMLRSSVPRDADVVWHPANGTFFRSAAPSVATIHDAVPFRYPSGDARARAAAQEPFLRSARSAARVIAVSHFGAGEVQAVFGVDATRIDVIYHGVDAAFAPGPADVLPAGIEPHRYFLFVGSPQEPRKNFSLLHQAFAGAFASFNGPPIVVAGTRVPNAPGVVAAGELGDDLHSRNNDRLRDLYRGAIALLLPSYHETFGLPMIEAMACGTPVVASDAGCLPEIGRDAALFVPPHDRSAWSAAIRRVAGDETLRGSLRARGLERARAFSWDESLRRHLRVFTEVASA
jgi:glycosyltransferase involved in cell wall biosynthesis